MKTKLQLIFIVLIIISGFIFYTLKKDEYNLAKELTSMDEQTKVQKTSALTYLLPFLKSDFQKKIDNGEKVNFLLLGYGGEGHSGAFLTDTIILGQMNFGSGEVTLMNMPRDLYLVSEKINTLYAIYNQDPARVVSKIEELTQIPISFYLTIDFDGFREAVDKMGGLEIYVENSFNDYNYPRNDNDQVDAGVMTVSFEEGWETMTGERALQFARSRYALEDGGDYNRSMRQQKVIQAFKEKLLETKDLKTLFTVAQSLSSHFQTDFPYVEGISLYKYSNNHEITIKNKILSEENYLYSTYNEEGSFILLPQDNDWRVLKTYFNSTE